MDPTNSEQEQRSLEEQRMSSAEQLQDIRNQLTTASRRDSVSMHAVTILTLVFLPATFVAVSHTNPHSLWVFLANL